MDWRALIAEVEEFATLAPQDAAQRLAQVNAQDPLRAATLGRLWGRAAPAGFMATSAGAEAGELYPAYQAGERVGAWRIEAQIGEGGMARVYRASRADGQFEQIVALKVMHAGAGGAAAHRFDGERKRLAALEHPGISRIIDGGATPDGRPFMAIELVEGETIDVWARAARRPRAEVLRLVCRLCEAVSHAHARLILHRDIKASNVLVTQDGQIKLIDFGIAAGVGGDDALGLAPLTLATAAPEQLRGDAVTAATDVFAVGMLIHALAAGALPKRRPDGGVTIDAKAVASADLSALVRRATAFAPADRYLSADALRHDLLAFLDRRPVQARGAGFAYRAAKALQRSPIAFSLGLALIAALATGVTLTLQGASRAEAARARAEYALAGSQRALATQSAYADTLVRLFEGDFDSDRLRTVLLEQADAAHRDRALAPDRAGHVAYAIGTIFLDQGDFATGRTVLERWLDEGYGEEGLRREGRIMLARGRLFTGDVEGGVEMFETLGREYVGTPDENSERHVYIMVQLAMGTRTPEAMARAREGLSAALAGNPEPGVAYRHLANLHLIEERSGNLEAAYAAIRKAADLRTTTALVDAGGDDGVTIGLLRFVLFLKGDLGETRREAEALLQRATQKNAVHTEAYALFFLGEVAAMEGRAQEALALLKRVRDLELSLQNNDLVTVGSLAEAMVDVGDRDGARALLAQHAPPVDAAPSPGKMHPRLVLAHAWLALAESGPQAASAILASWGVSRTATATNVIGDQRRRRLEARGVRFP
jgi:tetratricopeptide (TPR) repeat protein